MTSTKDLDIVLFGATGYTGSLAAEYIAKTFPTSLKWAIAGRSTSSLEILALRLKEISIDRTQPGNFTPRQLNTELTRCRNRCARASRRSFGKTRDTNPCCDKWCRTVSSIFDTCSGCMRECWNVLCWLVSLQIRSIEWKYSNKILARQRHHGWRRW